eukprot:COSAG02_NODE_66815_length_254_cov_1.000000_1_plen_45_part_01
MYQQHALRLGIRASEWPLAKHGSFEWDSSLLSASFACPPACLPAC